MLQPGEPIQLTDFPIDVEVFRLTINGIVFSCKVYPEFEADFKVELSIAQKKKKKSRYNIAIFALFLYIALLFHSLLFSFHLSFFFFFF